MDKTFENWSIEKARDIILKYTLPDALKPEYDGLTAYELARILLEAATTTDNPDLLEELIVNLQIKFEKIKQVNEKLPL